MPINVTGNVSDIAYLVKMIIQSFDGQSERNFYQTQVQLERIEQEKDFKVKLALIDFYYLNFIFFKHNTKR